MMKYKRVTVDGLSIFYRCAGDPKNPVLFLLHGFPSASHYYRQLMPLLSDSFYCIAPDMVGFGQTDSPDREVFDYTFDHEAQIMRSFLNALKIDHYYLYLFDYGAPVGFRLATKTPDQILGIVSQNGNIYEEGLGPKWQARKAYWQNPTPAGRKTFSTAYASKNIKEQYLGGEKEELVSPDGYNLDIFYSRTISGYAEKQNDLIFDYQSNVALYPTFQRYLRENRPKLLAIWGKNDQSFIWAGARAFLRDVPDATIVPLDPGHFALESHAEEIAGQIRKTFLYD